MWDAVIPHLDLSMNFLKLSFTESAFGNNTIYNIKKKKNEQQFINLEILAQSLKGCMKKSD